LLHAGFDCTFQPLFRAARDHTSSSAGESHPHARPEPAVNLAAPPAPIVPPQAVPPSARAPRGAAAVAPSVRAPGGLAVAGPSAAGIAAWPSGPASGPGPGRAEPTPTWRTAQHPVPIRAGWACTWARGRRACGHDAGAAARSGASAASLWAPWHGALGGSGARAAPGDAATVVDATASPARPSGCAPRDPGDRPPGRTRGVSGPDAVPGGPGPAGSCGALGASVLALHSGHARC
jgi:hypothetical protein